MTVKHRSQGLGEARRADVRRLYEQDRVDFAEAYLVASAESTGWRIASLDRSLDRVRRVERIAPPAL